ncbi:tetratricopeptide repeat protein 31 isoform X3 [Dromaius novaehollandiae]|uniref:tetratricopeptide repeat protein 31 isoform X3 n=1 Tax=Dromaius novaehollandiae TaxID=8790 RepID=UPI00311EC1DB
MLGAGGPQGPAGAAFDDCPWGCVRGAGGWSGSAALPRSPAAPRCPLHAAPGAPEPRWGQRQTALDVMHHAAMGDVFGAQDAFDHGGARRAAGQRCSGWEFRYNAGHPEPSSEEENEEEEWTDYSQDCDVPDEDSNPAYHFCGFKKSFLCKDPLSARSPQRFLDTKMHVIDLPWKQQVTAEEAEKNAKELVAEEERMKKKAEKKKLKKKKQKDRKRQEKLCQELKSKEEAELGSSSLNGAAGAGNSDNSGAEEAKDCPEPSPSQGPGERAACPAEEGAGGPEAGTEEAVEDELDLSCIFVSKAWQKAGVKLPVPGKEKAAKTGAEPDKRPQEKEPEPEPSPPCLAAPQEPSPSPPCLAAPQEPEPVPLDASVVEQSLILAGCGNEAAQSGRYAEAVQAFTEAVKLNPREYRLFGNRSYCYEKLQQYEEALRDAQVSLSLQPTWPKGFFRKGKALRGLKRYAEAVSTFEELLRLDGSYADAAAQLQDCRALLQQTGSGSASSPGGVPAQSLLETGEPPLPLSGEWTSGSCSDADRNGFVTVTSSRSHSKGLARAVVPASSKQSLTLPLQHPARDCYPLWVGNVTARITEKVLQSSFSRFGQIRFIRMLPERHCAFINFTQKASAEAAYKTMLGADVEGTKLVLQLKHPSHATPPPGNYQRPAVK